MTDTKNIPEYLREHGLFCLWKYEDRDGRRTKMPYNPNRPQDRAKSNDPATFATLEAAAARTNGFDGLGVGIFGEVAGIDIDHCMKDGKLSAMAADIVETMDAYTEISPSGEGLRILFLAPGFRYDTGKYYIKESGQGLEIYIAGMTQRYLTVTGNTLRTQDMIDRSDRLQTILDKYMKRPQQPTQNAAPMPGTPADISDRELLDKAMNARNGGQFKSLWEGSIMNYPSQSEADQALCNLLAFWTGKDAARMDALFRQSGLMRDKWNRRQSGTTYGAITIQKAIASCGEVYTPPQERPQAPQTDETRKDDKIPTDGQKSPQEAPQPRKTPLQLFDDFIGKVQTEAYKPLQTGMPAFDRLLGGGIQRQALVILTAAPGTGKTALTSQVFEAMAKAGADVVFLNLEMSREQLLARSVSRIAYRNGNKSISAADVLQGYLWKDNDIRRDAILKAAEEYRNTIAERMHYNPEGTGTTLDSIMKTLEEAGQAAKAAGKPAPVCVLDYLHLITTDKREEQAEILKKAVAELKAWAIRYDTFVFAISASNRTSNSSGVQSLDSGRDTSAIEYSADIQLSLNYTALTERRKKPNSTDTYKANDPDDMAELQKGNADGNREMTVQVLKSRMNAPGRKLHLLFNPAASVFYEIDRNSEPLLYGNWQQVPEDENIPFI